MNSLAKCITKSKMTIIIARRFRWIRHPTTTSAEKPSLKFHNVISECFDGRCYISAEVQSKAILENGWLIKDRVDE